ncbi:MAG: hypothetical protein JWN03_8554 [Nocardia sp.]|uniref:SEC-C domain-containing protein n=1 Tax=Nocardia sp. TaxID=1821 RepID=UPI002633E760|nr:SEC-C domain-containing protein [Nocardia sp.]MCU1648279.1 hypothetical protein [Nocardia sp.]
MSEEMSVAERREYERLLRQQGRLLAEKARLGAQLADVAGPFPSPRELALEHEQAAAADPEERAQNLSEAGSYWAMAGEPERARRAYLAAIADGGPVAGDARIWYALFLIENGDEAAGVEILDTVFAEGADDYVVYQSVGEMYEERSEPKDALRWFEAGLARVRLLGDQQDEGFGEYRLAFGRKRIRQSMDLPEDADDRWAEQKRDELVQSVDGGRPARGAPQPMVHSVFYFPEAELDRALKRWPELREHFESHDEHRAAAEHSLSSLVPIGSSPLISIATVAGLIDYAAAAGSDPTLPSTRAAYAVELARIGQAVAWPPGRNDPCWCGSSRKYKKCCGRPR